VNGRKGKQFEISRSGDRFAPLYLNNYIRVSLQVAHCHGTRSFSFVLSLILQARYSIFAALLIFFAAAMVSGPLFFRNQFRTYNCSNPLPGCRLLIPEPSYLFQNGQFRTAYQAIWSTLGTFLPLVLLTVSSCGLVGVLYRTRISGITSPERYPCSRVTATVTAVVVTFIVLVCPSTVCEVS